MIAYEDSFDFLADDDVQAIYQLATPHGEASQRFYNLLANIKDTKLKLALEDSVNAMLAEAVEAAYNVGSAICPLEADDAITLGDRIFVIDGFASVLAEN